METSHQVRAEIEALARKHGVTYRRTGSDALADVITRLAGDEVVTDDTEDLLVALRRAGVIDGPTMVSLLGRYLDALRQREDVQKLIDRLEPVLRQLPDD